MHRSNDAQPGVPRRLLEPGAVEAARRITDPRLRSILCQWLGDSGRLILGPTGYGKSLCLAQAARRLAAGRDRGLSLPKVLWCRVDSLSRGGPDVVLQAKRAAVLVLDDLGWEKENRSFVILEIIGERYDAGKVTAATSGLTTALFLRRYGDAVLRRLVEVGSGELVDAWEQPKEQLTLVRERGSGG